MTLTTTIYKNFVLDYQITVDVLSIDGFNDKTKNELLTTGKSSFSTKDINGDIYQIDLILTK